LKIDLRKEKDNNLKESYKTKKEKKEYRFKMVDIYVKERKKKET